MIDMDRIKELRNEIIENLKSKYQIVFVEIDGKFFAAADIAIKDERNNLEIYRISIIKCNQSD